MSLLWYFNKFYYTCELNFISVVGDGQKWANFKKFAWNNNSRSQQTKILKKHADEITLAKSSVKYYANGDNIEIKGKHPGIPIVVKWWDQ